MSFAKFSRIVLSRAEDIGILDEVGRTVLAAKQRQVEASVFADLALGRVISERQLDAQWAALCHQLGIGRRQTMPFGYQEWRWGNPSLRVRPTSR